MYNDELRNTILDDLESRAEKTVSTCIALASQGYLVNKSKQVRVDWTAILLHAFENIDVLNEEQKHNVELLYNKLSTI